MTTYKEAAADPEVPVITPDDYGDWRFRLGVENGLRKIGVLICPQGHFTAPKDERTGPDGPVCLACSLLEERDHYRTSFRSLRDLNLREHLDSECWCGHPDTDHSFDPVRDYRELKCSGCSAS